MAGWRFIPHFVAVISIIIAADAADSSDADILLKFKASLSDPAGALANWDAATPPCTRGNPNWFGVLCDGEGSVSMLRLEGLGFTGPLSVGILGSLPRLRGISFVNNSLEGSMPEVAKLGGLRTVFLSMNKFSGEIPDGTFAGMASLKKLHLSHNEFSGRIPTSIARLPKLLEAQLDYNRFSGAIPDFPSKELKVLNLSNNNLEGSIPESIRKMTADMFSGNKGLCGEPLGVSCSSPLMPSSSSSPPPSLSPASSTSSRKHVVFGAVAISIVTAFVMVIFVAPCKRQMEHFKPVLPPQSSKPAPKRKEKLEEGRDEGSVRSTSSTGKRANPEQPRLTFVKECNKKFELQDLLKSSAEVLRYGNFGCSYRASLLSGISVVVKRFRHMNKMGKEDFGEHMRRLGRLSHPNLLPLVAYYYRKDEKLMVTDYIPKRSLANALHGSHPANNPSLNWSARLKIVKGIAKGLNYLYEELQMLSVPHGQLKASNVLLSDSLEPLLTDYALVPVINQAQAAQFMVAYKSPESKQQGKASKKSDIWSLGILILEILTCKIPTTELQEEKGGVNLAAWVSSVAQGEWASKVLDAEMKVTKNSEGDMIKLLQIGLACCEEDVEKRWELEQVLDRVEELKEMEMEMEGDEDGAKIQAEGGAATEGELTTVDIN